MFIIVGPPLIDLFPAFAQAFNLKTHKETHRAKPHTCPHSSCGRSFSRKHDLGRNVAAINRNSHLNDSHVGVERTTGSPMTTKKANPHK